MPPIARQPPPEPQGAAPEGVLARARRFGPLVYRELGWRQSPPAGPGSRHVGRALAPHLDRWWRLMEDPDPFVVIVEGPEGEEVVRGVLAAVADCASALRLLIVQPDDAARARTANVLQLEPPELVLGPLAPGEFPDDDAVALPRCGPLVAALAAAPEVAGRCVSLAVGLLSRLPADVVEWRNGQWFEVRRAAGPGDDLVDVLIERPPERVPQAAGPGGAAPHPEGLQEGWRVPVTDAATEWLTEARARSGNALVVVVDQLVPRTVDLAGTAPLPGVALDQLDPSQRGRRYDDEALSPLVLVQWGAPTSGGPPRRWQ